MKVEIEIDELAGCRIIDNDKVISWEDLTRKQQIRILNSFANFNLNPIAILSKFLKVLSIELLCLTVIFLKFIMI